MQSWIFAAILVVQAHFSASYIVPAPATAPLNALDAVIRWIFPWSATDAGLLGKAADSGAFVIGFFIAVTAAALSLGAALAVLGVWLPREWWRPLAIAASVVSLALMAGFFGPTKVIPVLLDLAVLYVAIARLQVLVPR